MEEDIGVRHPLSDFLLKMNLWCGVFQFSETSVRQCLPSQLKPKPPVSELGFGTQFTDHMLRVEYDVDKGGWQSPLIVPLEPLTLHPAAKGLHYALQVKYKSTITIKF